MLQARTIFDSPLHRQMTRDGFELVKGSSESKKLELTFEYETENYFKYSQRIAGNKTVHMYIPKFILGKREIVVFLGKHQYEKKVVKQEVGDGFDCFFFMNVEPVVQPNKLVRRKTTRRKATTKRKK